jgi:hypothetical protein
VPTHWTYKPFDRSDGLFQGDIIAREPLLGVLGEVHKHFCDPKYLAFIVVTQTCDLVVRSGVCKTRYIGLAVVRSLASVLPELLDEMLQPSISGVYPEEDRQRCEELLHRVLNQNEQAHGMVYIHPDGDIGIGEPAVALLRVSITLRAREHYRILQDARVGRMDTEYRNKMGWLAGNLYSRIDTTDWRERTQGDQLEDGIISQLLNAPNDGLKPLWLPSSWLRIASTKADLKALPREDLEATIKSFAPKPPLDVAIAEIEKLTENLRRDFSDKPADFFHAALSSDPCLTALLLPIVRSAVKTSVVPLSADRLLEFEEVLAATDSLRDFVVKSVKDAINTFHSRRGPRHVTQFVDLLNDLPILALAADLITECAEKAFGRDCRDALDKAVRNTKPSPALIEHLKCQIHLSIQETIAKRLTNRLENSSSFKSALRSR